MRERERERESTYVCTSVTANVQNQQMLTNTTSDFFYVHHFSWWTFWIVTFSTWTHIGECQHSHSWSTMNCYFHTTCRNIIIKDGIFSQLSQALSQNIYFSHHKSDIMFQISGHTPLTHSLSLAISARQKLLTESYI
jgi:hypothetical protein